MTSYNWYRPMKTTGERRYGSDSGGVYGGLDDPLLNIKQTEKGDGKEKRVDKRRIEVQESGEAILKPDKLKLIITYCSVKEDVEAVKHSITRRADYIIQTLKNNGVKDANFTVQKNLQRRDNVYQMDLEIHSEFSDFKACESVSNFLIEKLDEGVKVSPPLYFHSKGKMENLRRQASLNAVRNARLKAQTMAQYLNMKLGNAILIQEEDTSEYTGVSPVESLNSETVESLTSATKSIDDNTVTVTVRVRAAFEVDPRIKKKGK